jgi:hypothetical protein
MFPNVYGFDWTPGRLIFLGIFFTVVLAIAVTVALAWWRTLRDIRAKKLDSIRWHAEFHDLASGDRACRHEFTGEYRHRTCDRFFDCRRCPTHAQLTAAAGEHTPAEDANPFGLSFPAGLLYHRGHTWVREEPDGTVTIGLDDFARRLVGTPEEVHLPLRGCKLTLNAPAWSMRRGGVDVRVLAPVDGEVIETGGPNADFYLKLKPPAGHADTRHLLRGAEIPPWLSRELERLQLLVATPAGMPALADGGVLAEDLPANCPEADWDAVWGHLFLEP